MKKAIIFLLFLIMLVSSCAKTPTEQGEKSAKETAIDNCRAECQKAIENGRDLSNGPCLSNRILNNWVCDTAHSPRQDIDNRPENQCAAFRAREASHFVELDESCNLINAW